MGGKLSDLQAGSRGASALTARLPEERKIPIMGCFGSSKGRETHSAFSLARRKTSEVGVKPLSLSASVGSPTGTADFQREEKGQHDDKLETHRLSFGSVDRSCAIGFGRSRDKRATRHD